MTDDDPNETVNSSPTSSSASYEITVSPPSDVIDVIVEFSTVGTNIDIDTKDIVDAVIKRAWLHYHSIGYNRLNTDELREQLTMQLSQLISDSTGSEPNAKASNRVKWRARISLAADELSLILGGLTIGGFALGVRERTLTGAPSVRDQPNDSESDDQPYYPVPHDEPAQLEPLIIPWPIVGLECTPVALRMKLAWKSIEYVRLRIYRNVVYPNYEYAEVDHLGEYTEVDARRISKNMYEWRLKYHTDRYGSYDRPHLAKIIIKAALINSTFDTRWTCELPLWLPFAAIMRPTANWFTRPRWPIVRR